MSTETKDQATPNVAQQGIDQAQAGSTPAAADAGASPAATSPEKYNAFADEDAQLAELAAKAAKEAKAKEGGAAAAPAGDGGQAAAAPAQAGGQQAKSGIEQAAAASKNSEQSAIIALRKQAKELRDQNLVLQGQLQALSGVVDGKQHAGQGASQQQGEQGQEGEQTIEQQLETIDAELMKAAEKVDKGELTMAQYQQQERALRKQERELAAEQNAALLEAAGTNSSPANDLGLQESTVKLVQDFPFLNELSRAQLEPYEALAYAQAEREGKPIPAGALGTKELRNRMAEIAERDYAPTNYAARQAAKAATAGGAGNGQGTQGKPAGTTGAKPGQGTQPSAAEREAALRKAGNMPPDLGAIGAGAVAGEVTESQGAAILGSLKDEDSAIRWLDQNPQFVQKVAGKSFRVPVPKGR